MTFVDAAELAAGRHRRIYQHRSFVVWPRGKTSVDWFFGFTLHLVFNNWGKLLTFTLTPGNVDNRVSVKTFAEYLAGKLFGDKGHLSQPLVKALKRLFGVELITPRCRNMQPVEIPLRDKLRPHKHAIVAALIDQPKNISQIKHTRHRSPTNFLVNFVCGLIAYGHQPKKPSLQLNVLPLQMLA